MAAEERRHQQLWMPAARPSGAARIEDMRGYAPDGQAIIDSLPAAAAIHRQGDPGDRNGLRAALGCAGGPVARSRSSSSAVGRSLPRRSPTCAMASEQRASAAARYRDVLGSAACQRPPTRPSAMLAGIVDPPRPGPAEPRWAASPVRRCSSGAWRGAHRREADGRDRPRTPKYI